MNLSTSLQQASKYILYATCAIALLVVIYVRVRLLPVPLERDEGEFAYFGQLLLQGMNPITTAYTMKLPGVGAVYALFMLLFGQTPAAIHLGLLVVNGLCIVLLYLLAQHLFDPRTAMFSASAFALLSLSQSVLGIYAHATHFIVLFSLAGFNLLLRWQESNKAKVLLLGSGLCFGLAFVMKQHAMLFILFALLYLFWQERRRLRAMSSQLLLICLFAVGVVAPYLLTALAMFLSGEFAAFWHWSVVTAWGYASLLTLSEGIRMFTAEFSTLPKMQPLLWLLAMAGGAAVFRMDRRSDNRLFILGLLLASALAVIPGLSFRPHYFVMMLPAVALLAGAGAASIETVAGDLSGLGKAVMPLLLCAAVGSGIILERSYLFSLTPHQVSRTLFGANPFPEAEEIARYIKERTSPSDRIAVLGSEPELYFYADRLSATGFIYMYPLMESSPEGERLQRQMITEIERSAPKFLVVITVHASWLSRPDSPLILPEWKERYINSHYRQVGVIDIINPELTRYLLGEEVSRNYTPQSSEFITVYQRMGNSKANP